MRSDRSDNRNIQSMKRGEGLQISSAIECENARVVQDATPALQIPMKDA